MMLIPKSDYRITSAGRRGRGVFARRDIAAGTVLGDYLGTIIKPDSNDENEKGMYDMRGGKKYDLLGDPKKEGVHLINHSCTNNCDAYPYRGHILYVAIRKIFNGEEITADYGLGAAAEKNISCSQHACHCGSKFCTGTIHADEKHHDAWFEAWEKLVKRNSGKLSGKLPAKYGDELKPLPAYPSVINTDDPIIYPRVFGSEKKPALPYPDAIIPRTAELRKRIASTGRRLLFPKLHFLVYGIRNHTIVGERK